MANQRKLVVRLTDLGGRCRVRQAQNAVLEGTGALLRPWTCMQDETTRLHQMGIRRLAENPGRPALRV